MSVDVVNGLHWLWQGLPLDPLQQAIDLNNEGMSFMMKGACEWRGLDAARSGVAPCPLLGRPRQGLRRVDSTPLSPIRPWPGMHGPKGLHQQANDKMRQSLALKEKAFGRDDWQVG